jgi:hypothetical protein
VAVLLYLMGEPPEAVAVHGVNLMRPGAYDDLHLELGFTRDRSAHIHASCCWPDPRGSIHVFGHRGMIVYEEAHQTLVLHRRFLAGDLGPDPLELLDFGSFHLLEDPWRVPGPADQPAAGEGNGTGPDGPVDPEVLRVLQRTELQLEHSKCI